MHEVDLLESLADGGEVDGVGVVAFLGAGRLVRPGRDDEVDER